MKTFQGFEIQACVVDYEEAGIEYICLAPSDGTVTFWGVYGRLPDGLAEWIADFPSREEAEKAVEQWGKQ